MKIATLITAHDNPKCLNALLAAIDIDEIDKYLLIDNKARKIFRESKLENKVTMVLPSMSIYWGGYSQIEATLALIRAALERGYDYYITLSGVDYPVKPICNLLEYLEKGICQYITCEKMPSATKQFYRLETVTFQQGNRARRYIDYPYQVANRISRKLYTRGIYRRNFMRAFDGMAPYAGWTWWALTHDCLKSVLRYIESHKKYLCQYKYTFCADEIFIHTIIMNSPYRDVVKSSLTHAIWDEPASGLPAIVSEKHIREARDMDDVFFIRKLSDKDSRTLEYAIASTPRC